MKSPKILVIHRRSKYTEMLSDGPSNPVTALFERKDSLVNSIIEAHEKHVRTMNLVQVVFKKRGIVPIWRHDLTGVHPDDFDLVVTVGGDGTVLHASHSVGDTPILAINSSPTTSIGYFTVGDADCFEDILDAVLNKEIEPASLFRMEVSINGEVVGVRVLNDVLFSHVCPASTTRYILSVGEKSEAQLSSGVWVSTAAGSTAVLSAAGGEVMSSGSDNLQYVVREPGPIGGAQNVHRPNLTKGIICRGSSLSIRSKISAARLYIDGPHLVVPVEFGDIITFYGSSRPLRLFNNQIENNA